MEAEIKVLNLLAPVFYAPLDNPDPFGAIDEAELASGREKLFCFELDETWCNSIEPDKEKLLKSLFFAGIHPLETSGTEETLDSPKEKTSFELPAGNYLFIQKREIADREEIMDMIIEIQQEGLWQRLKLGKELYLRYLYEDGSSVTQLFRPYNRKASTI